MTPPSTRTPRLVTAEMLPGLPKPVQRYLTYTGIVGTPWIDTVRITYAGNFRMAADRPWMPVRAVLYVDPRITRPRGFVDPMAAASLTRCAKIVIANQAQVTKPYTIWIAAHVCNDVGN